MVEHDHITQNILTASRHREYNFSNESFKRSVLYKLNDQNMKLLMDKTKDRVEMERYYQKSRMTKWDRFRDRR